MKTNLLKLICREHADAVRTARLAPGSFTRGMREQSLCTLRCALVDANCEERRAAGRWLRERIAFQ